MLEFDGRVGSLNWTNRALVIHGASCDQPWAGKDPGEDPGLSCVVASDDTAHTLLLPNVLQKGDVFLRSGKFVFPRNTEQKCYDLGIFHEMRGRKSLVPGS